MEDEMNFLLEDSDSDDELPSLIVIAMEEELQLTKPRLGSIPGRANIWRDLFEGHDRLYRDYFAEKPTYPSNLFRRRFRMYRSVFLHIHSSVEAFDPYFVEKRNACGLRGLSSLQNITAAMRLFAYGVAADLVDEYVRIGEITAIECLEKFVNAAVSVFSDEYLRSSNVDDLAILLEENQIRGFPGMLGSLDCMHWKWKNCPIKWREMYCGRSGDPTIILEVVASRDTWIWHTFFGLPGSHNDINVLDRSSLFTDLAEGRAPRVNYSINGHDYTMGYYFADGLYPQWATFVKTISFPQEKKDIHFPQTQESTRNDVERAFRILQARFAIVCGPARSWKLKTLKKIMKACIIMHNMIVEDNRGTPIHEDTNYDGVDSLPIVTPSHERTVEFVQFIQSQSH